MIHKTYRGMMERDCNLSISVNNPERPSRIHPSCTFSVEIVLITSSSPEPMFARLPGSPMISDAKAILQVDWSETLKVTSPFGMLDP